MAFLEPQYTAIPTNKLGVFQLESKDPRAAPHLEGFYTYNENNGRWLSRDKQWCKDQSHWNKKDRSEARDVGDSNVVHVRKLKRDVTGETKTYKGVICWDKAPSGVWFQPVDEDGNNKEVKFDTSLKEVGPNEEGKPALLLVLDDTHLKHATVDQKILDDVDNPSIPREHPNFLGMVPTQFVELPATYTFKGKELPICQEAQGLCNPKPIGKSFVILEDTNQRMELTADTVVGEGLGMPQAKTLNKFRLGKIFGKIFSSFKTKTTAPGKLKNTGPTGKETGY